MAQRNELLRELQQQFQQQQQQQQQQRANAVKNFKQHHVNTCLASTTFTLTQ